MSKTEILKSKLIALVNELNESSTLILKFNQQVKTLENMSISGANGRLYINPTNVGYDVSLSGKSLEQNLHNAFKTLFNEDCTGYKQTNRNTGVITQPFWRTDDFSLVKQAALLYTKTK
mgnify:CR=1 FL=1|jgi:hypothetical protein|tara:strand:- start:452 stop:808 length:357 start_codon:yes stop_codon:yes gene_type:complete